MPTLLRNYFAVRFSLMCSFFLCILLQSCSKMDENLPDAAIISLQISGLSSPKISILTASKTVEITVAYGVSVKSLTPLIEITAGASIVPASKIPQDFSQPIYYVLTSAEGKKTAYKVSVISLKQPVPEITNFDKNEVEAGESIVVKGKYFGHFAGTIQAYLVNAKNEEWLITARLIDSTQLELTIPKTVLPQHYAIKINVNTNTVTSISTITVQYPTPEITGLSKKNILQGDTLFVKGNFISGAYFYKLQFSDGKNQVSSTVEKSPTGDYYSILHKSILAGNYTVQLLNETTQKSSKSQDFTIHLYDLTKPFVLGIMNPKPSYQAGDKIIFKTQNFERFPARFFQIQLSTGKEVWFQNGIYNKISNTLTFELPTTLKGGNYGIALTLLTTTNQAYALEMDETLVVK